MTSVADDRVVDEVTAFLAALASRAPDAPTACRGWQVRDVVAHLAAGALEESDLIEAALRGEPSRPTRPFAEREATYRQMPYPELLAALARHSGRLSAAIDTLTRAGGTVEFTGTRLTGAEYRTHSRCELAVHRWDIAGNDDVGRRLLSRPALTAHTARILSTMTSLQESITARVARLAEVPDEFSFRLCSPDTPDVLVRVAPVPIIHTRPTTGAMPVVHSSASDRLLLLWGRRTSDDRIDLSGVPVPESDLIKAILYLC
jgi:uncharacterized protein (TIGR03083 family)